MARVRDVIQRDTRANQPLATAVDVGTLFYVTDESTTERSNGTTWETYADAGGGSASDIILTGTYAALPAPGTDGRIYLPTDSNYLFRDTGAAWSAFLDGKQVTLPLTTGWSWVNQGGATIATSNGFSYLEGPLSATLNIRARVRNAPSTPYTITCAFTPGMSVGLQAVGLVFRNNSAGTLVTFGPDGNGGEAGECNILKFNSPTSFNSNPSLTEPLPLGPYYWLRIADDGVNRISSYSTDGINFIDVFTEGRTVFLTADEIGFWISEQTNVNLVSISLLSWDEA